MKRPDWKKILADIPPGLTYSELSRRVGHGYHQTRSASIELGYQATDGRHYGQHKNRKVKVEKVDWTKPNVEISRQFGVSRERVRVLRQKCGKDFVESRGRRPNLKTNVRPS